MSTILVGLLGLLIALALHQLFGGKAFTANQLPILQQNTVFLHSDSRSGTFVRNENLNTIVHFETGEGGFFEVFSTVINRQRMRKNADLDQPIIARLHSARHLTVFDPATAQTYNLASYGDNNIDQLIQYLMDVQ